MQLLADSDNRDKVEKEESSSSFSALRGRVFSGWTITRALYAGLGMYMIVQSSLDRQWFGALVGIYFASMGVFSWGCASGYCYGGKCEVPVNEKLKP